MEKTGSNEVSSRCLQVGETLVRVTFPSDAPPLEEKLRAYLLGLRR